MSRRRIHPVSVAVCAAGAWAGGQLLAAPVPVMVAVFVLAVAAVRASP